MAASANNGRGSIRARAASARSSSRLNAPGPDRGTAWCAPAWLVDDLLRRALLDDHPLVHEDHLVGDVPGEAHLVGDHEHRHPLLRQLAHHVEHVLDQLRVEGAGDLVEEHQLRIHGQRPGDRDALLLTAGKPGRILVDLVGQPDPLEQLRGPLAGLSVLRSSTIRCASTTFSIAVMCGNRLKCWKTMPILARP